MSLDQLIQQKADQLILNKQHKGNLTQIRKDLEEKLRASKIYKEVRLGGSHQRKTMIQGYSDIDLYCRYEGNEKPQTVLDRTKNLLRKKYCSATIKTSFPSILLEFSKVSIEITPYKFNKAKKKMVPMNNKSWKESVFFKLKNSMSEIFKKHPKLPSVVRVLKYWNICNGKIYQNFKIEKMIYNQFKSQPNKSLSWYIHTFFKGKPKLIEFAVKFEKLIEMEKIPNSPLRNEWHKFIDGN